MLQENYRKPTGDIRSISKFREVPVVHGINAKTQRRRDAKQRKFLAEICRRVAGKLKPFCMQFRKDEPKAERGPKPELRTEAEFVSVFGSRTFFRVSAFGFLLEPSLTLFHILTCQGPWNVDLRTPPGPEGSNGSLLCVCRGHPGLFSICDLRFTNRDFCSRLFGAPQIVNPASSIEWLIKL